MHVIEVINCIVELFRGARPEEPTSNLVCFSLPVVLLPRWSSRGSPKVAKLLPGRHVGHVVLIIRESAISKHTHIIKTLVGPLTETQMIFRLRFYLFAKKD